MSFTYTAELPLGDHTVFRLAGLLVAERQRRGTRQGTRTLSPLEQAMMVLRWFCDGTRTSHLFADHGGQPVGGLPLPARGRRRPGLAGP